jgi:hypothetical protein
MALQTFLRFAILTCNSSKPFRARVTPAQTTKLLRLCLGFRMSQRGGALFVLIAVPQAVSNITKSDLYDMNY